MPSTTLEQAIQVKLKATAAVTTIVSTRIYWISAPPDATLPYLTYRVISQDNLKDELGGDKDSTALVQFDIWSANQYNALTAARALIDTLEGFSGGFDSVNITYCTTNGPQQLRDPDFENLYHFIVDADFTYYR